MPKGRDTCFGRDGACSIPNSSCGAASGRIISSLSTEVPCSVIGSGTAVFSLLSWVGESVPHAGQTGWPFREKPHTGHSFMSRPQDDAP